MHIDHFSPSTEYIDDKYNKYALTTKINQSSPIYPKSISICDFITNLFCSVYSLRYMLLPAVGEKE